VNAFCRHVGRLAGTTRNPLSLVPLFLMRRREWRSNFAVGGMTLAARRVDLLAVAEVASMDEYAFLRDLSFPGAKALVLDLGANIGCFAAAVFSVCPAAEVHSFEPSPDTFAVLADNRQRYPQLAWHTHRAAVAADDGIRLFDNGGSSTGRKLSAGGTGVAVRTRTLGGLIAHVARGRRVFLCKMDIEGAEMSVFAGALDILADIDHLVVEAHGTPEETSLVEDRLAAEFPHVVRLPRHGSSKPLFHAWRTA
jgi:FkbM family methyltransferase